MSMHFLFTGQSTSLQYPNKETAQNAYNRRRNEGYDCVLVIMNRDFYTLIDTCQPLRVTCLDTFDDVSKYMAGRFTND